MGTLAASELVTRKTILTPYDNRFPHLKNNSNKSRCSQITFVGIHDRGREMTYRGLALLLQVLPDKLPLIILPTALIKEKVHQSVNINKI